MKFNGNSFHRYQGSLSSPKCRGLVWALLCYLIKCSGPTNYPESVTHQCQSSQQS